MPRREPVDPDDAAATLREGRKRGAADDAEADDRYIVDLHARRFRALRPSGCTGCSGTPAMIHYGRNMLTVFSTCPRSADSRAFADGQVKVQITPEGA